MYLIRLFDYSLTGVLSDKILKDTSSDFQLETSKSTLIFHII